MKTTFKLQCERSVVIVKLHTIETKRSKAKTHILTIALKTQPKQVVQQRSTDENTDTDNRNENEIRD